MRSIPFFLPMSLALTFFSPLTWANGGPVEWTKTSAAGDIRPKENISAALVEETLKIELAFDHYRVTALYTLKGNSKTTVPFGVPLVWMDYDDGEGLIPNKDQEFSSAGSRIRLRMNGKPVNCQPKLLDRSVRLDNEKTGESILQKGWCLASLPISKGTSRLEMSYRADYWFSDEVFTKSPLTEFGNRVVYYPLSPAGFWKGRVAKLDLQIDLGPYEGLEQVRRSPVRLNKQGSLLKGAGKSIDLKTVPPLVLSLKGVLAESHELMRWNSLKGMEYSRIKFQAKASSTLKGNYAVRNLGDGNPETAWCEGKKGGGVGEWVEFSIPTDFLQNQYCSFHGVIVTPGYLKKGAFLNNERLKKISLTECGQKNALDTMEFEPIRRFDLATKFKPLSDYKKPHATSFFRKLKTKQPACMRLTIDEVYPGRKFEDTCISEVALVVNCG